MKGNELEGTKGRRKRAWKRGKKLAPSQGSQGRGELTRRREQRSFEEKTSASLAMLRSALLSSRPENEPVAFEKAEGRSDWLSSGTWDTGIVYLNPRLTEADARC